MPTADELHHSYHNPGFAMIRVPLLPASVLTELGCDLNALSYAGATDIDVDSSMENALAQAEARAYAIAQWPEVREAIAVASPQLDQALSRYDRASTARKDRASVRRSLLRYIARMSTRPTPFGLFAGVDIVNISDCTSVDLAERTRRRKKTFVDMGVLYEIVRRIEAHTGEDELRRNLVWFTNTTYLVANGRVVSLLPGYGREEDFRRGSVRATEPVLAVLQWAVDGVKLDDLRKRLHQNYPNLPLEMCEEFLRGLIESQLLYSDLRPPLVGGDPAAWITEKLSRWYGTSPERDHLESLLSRTAAYDAAPLGSALEEARRLHLSTDDNDPNSRSTGVHVDTTAAVERGELSDRVTEEMLRAAIALMRTTTQSGDFDSLREYRDRMLLRYGYRLVPLTELLDPFVGLGFPDHYTATTATEHAQPSWGNRDIHLQRIAAQALSDGAPEVVLTDEDLAQIETTGWQDSLPDSFDVYGIVTAESTDAIDHGEFNLVIGALAAAVGTAPSFSRFCGVFGRSHRERLVEYIHRERKDEDSHVLHVELSYMPIRGSEANVAIRPPIQAHELLLGVPPSERTRGILSWRDIAVGVAPTGLYLWSMKHERPIAVHGTHMLTPHMAPLPVRLVTEIMASQTLSILPFDWGVARVMQRLPRVRFGKTILRLAEWKLQREAVPPHALASLRDFASWSTDWRERWDVPRQVALVRGDNRIPIDLNDPAFLDLLWHELGRSNVDSSVVIQEAGPWLQPTWLNGCDGRYICELVAPFARSKIATERAETAKPAKPHALRRRIQLPGSDWLTLKLYAAPGGHPTLLKEHIGPFISGLHRQEEIDRWFLVRYADPEPHVRVRTRFSRQDSPTLSQRILAWTQQLADDGLVRCVQLDTYDREIERYGGIAGLDACEEIFMVDSQYVVSLLSSVDGDDREELIHLAVYSMDQLIRRLGVSAAERANLYRAAALQNPDALELRERALRTKYRQDRRYLEQLLESDGASAPGWMREATEQMSSALTDAASRLHSLQKKRLLEVDTQSIVMSLAHMHSNRLLGIDPQDEASVYFLLSSIFTGFTHYRPPGVDLDMP